MSIHACDGIQQLTAATDLSVISPRDLLFKLGDNAAADKARFRDSDNVDQIVIDSNGNISIAGNTVITGDLIVNGTQQVVRSTEVWIGDSEITLNANVIASANNKYGGIAVKRVSLAAAYTTSSFVAATSTINVTTDPTSDIATGDIVYVSGTSNNDGLYEVDSVTAATIVILTTSTVPGAKLALVDETVAGKVNLGIQSFFRWDETADRWVFGYYGAAAAISSFQVVGIGAGGAVAFSNANPDLSAQGTSAANSGAVKIGCYDEFAYSSSTNVQDVLDDLDEGIATITSGLVVKSGLTAGITGGDSTVAVVFPVAYGTSCNQINATMHNVVDASPYHYTIMITAMSTTGFTATLSGPIPGAGTTNYKLSWTATGV